MAILNPDFKADWDLDPGTGSGNDVFQYCRFELFRAGIQALKAQRYQSAGPRMMR
jgi:hypothetical protein